MKKKIRDAFTQNIPLKILAAVLAFVLWVAVVNVDDPEKTVSFTVTVQITNQDALAANNQYYEFASSNTVTFRARGKRSIIEKMNASDFTATADLNLVNTDGEVPIQIVPDIYASRITIVSPQKYLQLKIGTVAENRFRVEGRTTGTPAEGFVVSSVDVVPNVITVKGPAEIVSRIDTVTAAANADGVNSGFTESVVPKFYDASGKQVDSSQLTLGVATVDVTVNIQNEKTVPVRVETSGTLPEGLQLGEVTADPAEVSITGDASVLNSVSEITIPGSVTDLSRITADWNTTVDISEYLPEGVSLADTSQSKVTVSVTLQSDRTETIEVPISNLMVRNLASGLSSAFQGTSIAVTLSGTQAELSGISASELTGYIDASGLTAGTYTRPVTWNLSNGITATSPDAEVVLTDSAAAPDNTRNDAE